MTKDIMFYARITKEDLERIEAMTESSFRSKGDFVRYLIDKEWKEFEAKKAIQPEPERQP